MTPPLPMQNVIWFIFVYFSKNNTINHDLLFLIAPIKFYCLTNRSLFFFYKNSLCKCDHVCMSFIAIKLKMFKKMSLLKFNITIFCVRIMNTDRPDRTWWNDFPVPSSKPAMNPPRICTVSSITQVLVLYWEFLTLAVIYCS